MKTNIHWW